MTYLKKMAVVAVGFVALGGLLRMTEQPSGPKAPAPVQSAKIAPVEKIAGPQAGDRILFQKRVKGCRSLNVYSLDIEAIKANCDIALAAGTYGTILEVGSSAGTYRIRPDDDAAGWFGDDFSVISKGSK